MADPTETTDIFTRYIWRNHPSQLVLPAKGTGKAERISTPDMCLYHLSRGVLPPGLGGNAIFPGRGFDWLFIWSGWYCQSKQVAAPPRPDGSLPPDPGVTTSHMWEVVTPGSGGKATYRPFQVVFASRFGWHILTSICHSFQVA
jgi:hypothetical protein